MVREQLQTIQTKLIAAKHGNPMRSLAVIAVAGEYGRATTITLLEAILKEAGRNPVVLQSGSSNYDRRADDFFAALAKVKKAGHTLVIVELTQSLKETGALKGQPIDTLIITGQHPQDTSLLSLTLKHAVTPTGLTLPAGSVEPYQHIIYGESDEAEARLEGTKLYRRGTEITVTIDHQIKLTLATYFAGKASSDHLLAAAAAAYVLGVDLDAIQEGIAELEPTTDVFYWHTTNRPYEVVSDPGESSEATLLAVQSAKALVKRRLIVVLSSSVDRAAMEEIQQIADRVFVVDGSRTTVSTSIDYESDFDSAFDKALRTAKRDDTVLFVGDAFRARIAEVAADEDHETQA